MKRDFARWCSIFPVLLGGLIQNGFAAPMIPANYSFVSVQATMPLASEPGNNPATFTFSRAGNTNSTATVTFNISGTATNGVDYALITNTITFSAGQTSSNIIITPVSEPAATGYKTVVLSLPESWGWGGGMHPDFIVGSIHRAVAYIAYNYTNVPPNVSITTPTSGSSYLSRPNIHISANAYDSNGWVTSIEFLANGASIGVVSNVLEQPLLMRESRGRALPIIPGRRVSRFPFVWTNVAPGSYSLTAIATDNAGLQTTSSNITISVSTNLPTPSVRIVSPLDGAQLPDLATINLYAAASEAGGVIDTVEFLANGTNLGVATNYLANAPFGSFHQRTQWMPFFFRWTNVMTGSNVLTAIATDNNGIMATSAPVSINVSTNAFHFHHR
jgi:hypothetical protein